MSKRLPAELFFLVIVAGGLGLALGGLETLPRYMLAYISQANLVYQGF